MKKFNIIYDALKELKEAYSNYDFLSKTSCGDKVHGALDRLISAEMDADSVLKEYKGLRNE